MFQATKTPGSMLLSKSTFSKSKTLGNIPGEMTCSSGYMADSSSARTPGQFLQKPSETTNNRNFVGICQQEEEEEEEDEEPTGLLCMMSEFQKGAGLLPHETSMSKGNVSKTQKERRMGNSFNQSLQGNTTDISRLIGGGDVSTRRDTSALKASFMKGTAINDVSLDCSMPSNSLMQKSSLKLAGPGLELTGAGPTLELTGAGPALELTGAGPSLELTVASPKLNISGPQLDLTQNATINSEKLGASYNPLDVSVHRKLLEDLKIPVAKRHGYFRTNSNIPQIRANSSIQVGPTTFNIKECKGKYFSAVVFLITKSVILCKPK